MSICKKPTLIILNGVPCSGKSTLLKNFQALSEEPYFSLGMDMFFEHVLPRKWFARGKAEGIYTRDLEGPQRIEMEMIYGPVGQHLITIMHKSIAAALYNGNNVILDHLLFDSGWYGQLNDLVKDFDPIWVKVTLPFDELVRREAIRKRAPFGYARYYYDRMHEGVAYSLEINTQKLIPQEAAQLLLDFVTSKK